MRVWGDNSSGQLSDTIANPQRFPDLPINLSPNVTAIAGGEHHTCAVDGDKLYCWGANNAGQLGHGNTTPTRDPTLTALP
jgi:alpha-tubulin suppressor-like RCC1 family protein